MEYTAIEQMYYGERGKGELLKGSKEYKLCYEMFFSIHQKFRKQIEDKPELIELFDEVIAALERAHAVDLKDKYTAGFRFGALMQMDILQGE